MTVCVERVTSILCCVAHKRTNKLIACGGGRLPSGAVRGRPFGRRRHQHPRASARSRTGGDERRPQCRDSFRHRADAAATASRRSCDRISGRGGLFQAQNAGEQSEFGSQTLNLAKANPRLRPLHLLNRLAYVDALRVVLIMLAVAHHSVERFPSFVGFGRRGRLLDAEGCDEPVRVPLLRPLHLVVRETEFCGQRLAGDFSRRMRENGRNSVRRPRHASLTDRNCEGFCRPGNRVGLPVLYGGGCRNRTDGHRSLASLQKRGGASRI